MSHLSLACVDPLLRSQPSPAPFPQITLGRATKDNQIDVDLSLEGPAWKISRKQGTSRKQCEGPSSLSLPSSPVARSPWEPSQSSWGRAAGISGSLTWESWAPSSLSLGSRVGGNLRPSSGLPCLLIRLRLSTRTGVIKLKNNGDFFIANEGRRPIYIDGRPVLCGSKWRLSNNSVVEVSCEGGGEVRVRPGPWGARMWAWPPVPPLCPSHSSLPPADCQPEIRLPHQPGPHCPHSGRGCQDHATVRSGGRTHVLSLASVSPAIPAPWSWELRLLEKPQWAGGDPAAGPLI